MNFLKKIFSPFCLTISLLVLIYTFYQSEIYWNGSKNDYYLPYYIIFHHPPTFVTIESFVFQGSTKTLKFELIQLLLRSGFELGSI